MCKQIHSECFDVKCSILENAAGVRIVQSGGDGSKTFDKCDASKIFITKSAWLDIHCLIHEALLP